MLERYSHWFGIEWFVSDRPISLLVVAWLAGTGCNWMQPVIAKGIILMVTYILIFTVNIFLKKKRPLATGIQTPSRRNNLSRVCCSNLCSKTSTWLQSHWSTGCSRRQDIFSYRTVTLEWLMWVLSWSFEHEEGFWVARTMKGTNKLCWLCLLWPAVFCMQSAAAIMIIIRSDEGGDITESTLTKLRTPWDSFYCFHTEFSTSTQERGSAHLGSAFGHAHNASSIEQYFPPSHTPLHALLHFDWKPGGRKSLPFSYVSVDRMSTD